MVLFFIKGKGESDFVVMLDMILNGMKVIEILILYFYVKKGLVN